MSNIDKSLEDFVNHVDDQTLIDPKRLFAYGSLMKGFFNYENVLKGKVISCTIGKVRGLLYHQIRKDYPAMVPGDGMVIGEFLELENFDEQISSCDKIEEYFGPSHPDNYYERRLSEIELENGEKLLAWIYWYIRNDLNSIENPVIHITSGNWREYKNKN